MNRFLPTQLLFLFNLLNIAGSFAQGMETNKNFVLVDNPADPINISELSIGV
jgi:uncharacterized membrane protein YqgA involved in biofilm formation